MTAQKRKAAAAKKRWLQLFKAATAKKRWSQRYKASTQKASWTKRYNQRKKASFQKLAWALSRLPSRMTGRGAYRRGGRRRFSRRRRNTSNRSAFHANRERTDAEIEYRKSQRGVAMEEADVAMPEVKWLASPAGFGSPMAPPRPEKRSASAMESTTPSFDKADSLLSLYNAKDSLLDEI